MVIGEDMNVAGMSLFKQVLRQLRGQTTRERLKEELRALPTIRNAITLARFSQLRRDASRSNSPVFRFEANTMGTTQVAVEHNSDLAWMFFPDLSARPDLISRVLQSLSTVRLNAHKMRLLIVGGRTEAEILSMMSAGFTEANIEAIDLFSYSPLIKTGTVISLPYESDYFDVIVVGWVLEFIEDIPSAISEIKRVVKDGGIIAVGAMYHPISMDYEEYLRRNDQIDRVWNPKSVGAILAAFSSSYESLIFSSDIQDQDIDKRSDLIAIFYKNGSTNEV